MLLKDLEIIAEARVSGVGVSIGDRVCFKSDVEQCGIIVKVAGNILTLKAPSDGGFEGGYIGGNEYTTVDARECWID